MADSVTTSFPKMGESLIGSIVNLSGRRSPNTIAAPRHSANPDQSVGAGTKQNRRQTMIHEANGPACKIIHTLYAQNAAEASATLKRTYVVKPAKGDQDFWSYRGWQQGV